MRRFSLFSFGKPSPFFLMSFFSLACGGDEKPIDSGDEPGYPPITETPTYHEDIARIIIDNCLSCHQEGQIGPFPLDSYETVRIFGESVADSVKNRRMPPYLADNSGDCNTYKDATWLSDYEIALIEAWVDGGMPEGDPANAPELPPESAPFEATHSVTFDVYEADFATAADDYRCFIVDPGLTQDSFLTAFEVLPSNPGIAHHMILYKPVDNAALADAYTLEAQDPGQGYSCFGGAEVDSSMVAPWAPGKAIWSYPEGTGILVEAGRPLIMQMHYSNASDDPLDSTTVNMDFSTEVDNELYARFFVNSDIEIPPGQSDHSETYSAKIGNYFGTSQPLTIMGLVPHMHKLGKSEYGKVVRADGSEECLMDVPRWDFNWQLMYMFEDPVVMQPDDKIHMECVFDSSDESSTVYWGDGTNDEMCLFGVFAIVGD